MPVSIPASTVCEPATDADPVLATCERIVREQIPNLLRLYPNPFVTQACVCLTQMIADMWPDPTRRSWFQVFLSNSGDEALSGAVKLARYAANREGRNGCGVIIDDDGLFPHFASTELSDGGRIEYIPGLVVQSDVAQVVNDLRTQRPPGFIVIPFDRLGSAVGDELLETIAGLPKRIRPTVIVSTGRGGLLSDDAAVLRRSSTFVPDIVVFDEALVRRDVPFGAFAARSRLFRHWRKRGMSTFHSTTFQPNTIASLHLLKCLRESHPRLLRRLAVTLTPIDNEVGARLQFIGDLYSRPLARLIKVTGFDHADVRATGHYVHVGERWIFDVVAGVACSIRGHNPPDYVAEVARIDDAATCREELRERLQELTGLPHVTPTVSGASAVETALKLALASQSPRTWVLALRGGFGGKTLFALTGTWKASLKAGLDPLYPHILYVDPFAADAVALIEAAFRTHPIGVAQLELVQGVGGVRAVPDQVLDCLQQMRRRHDTLLFVDEVQTGMWRTGSFVRSAALGIPPDLLTLGKGTSDMMFPSALTLHSDNVQQRLDDRRCDLAQPLSTRYEFDHGLRTILNVLRRGTEENLADVVTSRGRLFEQLLKAELSGCRNVREVRSHGLLIGIELRAPNRLLNRAFPQTVLLSMLRHAEFPLLAGYCQYEPHVLKLTPPLTITESEVRQVCATIGDVLRANPFSTVWSGLRRCGPRLTQRRTTDVFQGANHP